MEEVSVSSESMDNSSKPQTVDYEMELETRQYLQTYYQDSSTDENFINFHINAELKRMNRQFDTYVEISAEGTAHHLISIARHVKTAWLTDFRSNAREESKRFALGMKDAHNWSPYVRMALKNEGIEPSETNVAIRLAEMRERLLSKDGTPLTAACNIKEFPVIDLNTIPTTSNSLFGMFFVSGEVGETVDGWKAVMANVAKTMKPGAHIFISALRGMSQYEVHQPDGSSKWYPCAELYGGEFEELMPKLGFDELLVLDLEIPPHQQDVGLPGVIFVSATKA